MIKHFDFFRFYGNLLFVACDETDEIMGYFILEHGNQLSHIYVMPKWRGSNIVHHLVWKAVSVVKELGYDHLWGIMYPNRKKLYENYVKMWGARMEIVETPEERLDGQWNLKFYVDQITDDKAPKFKEKK